MGKYIGAIRDQHERHSCRTAWLWATCCRSNWWSADRWSHRQPQLTAVKRQPATSTCSLLVVNVIWAGMWDWWEPDTLLLIALWAAESFSYGAIKSSFRHDGIELTWDGGERLTWTVATCELILNWSASWEALLSLNASLISPIRLCSSPVRSSVDRKPRVCVLLGYLLRSQEGKPHPDIRPLQISHGSPRKYTHTCAQSAHGKACKHVVGTICKGNTEEGWTDYCECTNILELIQETLLTHFPPVHTEAVDAPKLVQLPLHTYIY